MEVDLTPELETKLNELAAQSGRPAQQLVRDALTGMFDEIADTQTMLDRRYHEIETGQVRMVPGHEVFARLKAKSEALRKRTPG